VDVARLLDKMQEEHVDGVILDLRHNGGGSLPEAIDLTGLFIKEGPVVQVRGSDEGGRPQVQVYDDRDSRVQYDGPLVVLTSRFSASASEIVAGALQDYGRALVVGGASTHGKGTVQSMSQLAPYLYMSGEFITGDPASLGALKYTTNKFYRVTGSSTQLKGVVPDIILPSTYDYMETEEASEENALKWDEIRTTDYEKLNRVGPYLPELEKRSAARVAKSRDFAYVNEDIDIVKKAMADKTVSLNEKQRLQESAEAETRRKAREAELKARKLPEEKVFDLTLKNGEVVMKEEPKPGTNDLTVESLGTNSPQVTVTNAASGTNGLAVGEDAAVKPAPSEIPPEEKAPLEEAEHILDDYISLMHSGGTLTADQQRN
jgi:carboxyl-terminal processing protease